MSRSVRQAKGFDDDYRRDLVDIDTNVPSAARVYDYLVGGTDNFAVDRQAAEQQAATFGGLEAARAGVRGNRIFLGNAVRWLAGPGGVRQFLDLGTGIPTMENVHEVAQKVAPEARIVYADNDPVVLAHAHELLRSTPEGATEFIRGDLHDPQSILEEAAATLDLNQPVAVMLIAILHLVPDEADPRGIVAKLMAAVPSGSYLAVSHLASDINPEMMKALADSVPESAGYRFAMRSHDEVSRFFDGLELVEPGVVPIDQWQPDGLPPGPEIASPAHHYGAIGRKP